MSQSAEAQIAGFIALYTDEVASLGRAAMAWMRARLPGAVELAFDNYNAFGVGFSSSDKTSGVVLSITLYPRWVSLFFMRGARLDDPQGLLQGSGSQVRHIVLKSLATLDDPAVGALIDQAVAASGFPFDDPLTHRVMVKSIAKRRLPRRPASERLIA